MDLFTAIVLGAITAGVLWVVCAGWLSRKLPIDQILDKRRNEKWAAQLSIEEHELPQMLAAANDYRSKRGLPEVSVAQLHAQVGTDLREQIADQARKQLQAKAAHGNLARERRGF
jgi:hypothetical protein